MATLQSPVQPVFDRYVQAVETADAEALLTLYADDVHVFDLMEPFERHGTDAVREMIDAWFAHENGQASCEIENLSVEESGDLAVARAAVRYGMTLADGSRLEMRNRATWALRRIDGAWRIIMEHTSVPLTGQDMQPVFDAR